MILDSNCFDISADGKCLLGLKDYCKNSDVLQIPSNIRRISHSAFEKDSNIKYVILPDGLKEIEDSTFFGCTGLTEINIPSSIERIYANAFSFSGLTEITIPNATIEDNVFLGCSKLKKVIIGNGVTDIGNYVFYNCQNLETLVLPDKFVNYTKLKNMSVPDNCLVNGKLCCDYKNY